MNDEDCPALKEHYPAVNKRYGIEVTPKDDLAVAVSWKRKALAGPSDEGKIFFARLYRTTGGKTGLGDL